MGGLPGRVACCLGGSPGRVGWAAWVGMPSVAGVGHTDRAVVRRPALTGAQDGSEALGHLGFQVLCRLVLVVWAPGCLGWSAVGAAKYRKGRTYADFCRWGRKGGPTSDPH